MTYRIVEWLYRTPETKVILYGTILELNITTN